MVRMVMAYDVGVEESTADNSIKLAQNMPNPFNGTSSISYELGVSGNVTFEVRDISGKQVLLRNEGKQAPGAYKIQLDGSELNAGVYFYTLTVDNKRLQKKMVVLE